VPPRRRRHGVYRPLMRHVFAGRPPPRSHAHSEVAPIRTWQFPRRRDRAAGLREAGRPGIADCT
jgi:hypothetical protein